MQEYIAKDSISKEILNSAKLLQTVGVNALILGEMGVGKKISCKIHAYLNLKFMKQNNYKKDIADDVLSLNNDAIIVDKLHEITNIDLFLKWIENNSIRVIAISNTENLNQKLKDIFSINLEIPNLSKREGIQKALVN